MNYAIVLAAGQGQRMSMKKDKLLLSVGGHPIIYYSLMAFNDHPEIDKVFLIGNKHNKKALEQVIKSSALSKVEKVVMGGLTRQKSVEKALAPILKKASETDVILVHNGANPLVSHEEITQTLEKCQEFGACIVGHYVTSTIKEVDERHIIKTHNRQKLFAAETPQAATAKVFSKALKNASKQKLEVTDEAMLFEAIGQEVAYVEAGPDNFKITNQPDYARLRGIMGDLPEDFRIGIGQDSHKFDEERKGLVLGGIELPDEAKLHANSDGDVILHAVFNGISQAIGEMSLGFYADKECENGVKDSKKYLKTILDIAKKQGFKVNSLGLMIEAGKPKIDPLVPNLKKSLSALLDLNPRRIGITATSGEKLTPFGQGYAIQCFAIVSLVK